jgi:hypothetical protein
MSALFWLRAWIGRLLHWDEAKALPESGSYLMRVLADSQGFAPLWHPGGHAMPGLWEPAAPSRRACLPKLRVGNPAGWCLKDVPRAGSQAMVPSIGSTSGVPRRWGNRARTGLGASGQQKRP